LRHSLIANDRQNNSSSEFQAQHTTNIMACPLLGKLAPETRNLIYEYVLTFDTPLKHAQKMKPFINKLYQRSDSEAETASDVGPSRMEDSRQRVDTALLSASRLIFKEAIVVFYENNTIYLDADDCDVASIKSPQATDLSLATQVSMKLSIYDKNDKSLSGYHNGMDFVQEGFPTVFPKLRTATIVISTDNLSKPVQVLFGLAADLHDSSAYSDAVFEGAGLVSAHSMRKPHLKIVVQCKAIVERWAAWASEGRDLIWSPYSSPFDLYARSAYPPSQDGRVNPSAIKIFSRTCGLFLPDDYPEVAEDSFEFWTIVDEVWRNTEDSMQHPVIQNIVGFLHNLHLSAQPAPSSTQPNEATSEKSGGGESGGDNDTANSSEPDSAGDGADGQSS
jgi:hypothetical protein